MYRKFDVMRTFFWIWDFFLATKHSRRRRSCCWRTLGACAVFVVVIDGRERARRARCCRGSAGTRGLSELRSDCPVVRRGAGLSGNATPGAAAAVRGAEKLILRSAAA